MNAAVTRYRVMALIVGVVLVVLTLVAMPLKYLPSQDPTLVELIGPLHGFLYMGYLVLTADLSRRARWSPRRTVLVMMAGTVPFLSFVAERRVTRWVHAETPTPVAARS